MFKVDEDPEGDTGPIEISSAGTNVDQGVLDVAVMLTSIVRVLQTVFPYTVPEGGESFQEAKVPLTDPRVREAAVVTATMALSRMDSILADRSRWEPREPSDMEKQFNAARLELMQAEKDASLARKKLTEHQARPSVQAEARVLLSSDGQVCAVLGDLDDRGAPLPSTVVVSGPNMDAALSRLDEILTNPETKDNS